MQSACCPKRPRNLGAFFSDYDQDGDLDLYAAGDRTPNLLYRNDGDRFAEVGGPSRSCF